MNGFTSILLPLDGSRTAARGIGCATWLASRLGARLHILSATSSELPAQEELRRLRVGEEHWSRIELHQEPEVPVEAILAAADHHQARLVVMSARGAATEGPASDGPELPRLIGHVTHGVIERSVAPVVLLPPGYREALPWERLLVPISGGLESDAALVLAVRLGRALSLSVHAAHVAARDSVDEELAARTRYSDALHHEYAAQLEELLDRALPTLAPEERDRIRGVELGRGDVAGELVHLIGRDRISALVVGWHGRFATGRAELLKRLIPIVNEPLVLVKSGAPTPFRLNVGEEMA